MAVEVVGIIAAFVFLAAAATTVWFSTRVLEIRDTGVLIALLLVPVVVYLVVSGRIGELRVPGGLEAKFVSATQKPIRLADRRVMASVQPVQSTSRGPSVDLPLKLAELDPFEPIVLTVTLGQKYNRRDWLAYVDALFDHPNFTMAVLLDRQERFIAYMTVQAIHDVLSNAALGEELIKLIEEEATDQIMLFPSVRTATISPDSTAIYALRKLQEMEADFLLVVGKEDHILGIVDSQDILRQIILDLAEDTVSGE